MILLWFYVADRMRVFSRAEKVSLRLWADVSSVCSLAVTCSAYLQEHSADFFLFTFVVLTAVAFGWSSTKGKAPSLLNRNQTEEWKGWMQVS